MLNLGRKQILQIIKKVEFGAYLSENGTEEPKVLLPLKQVPEEISIGDEIEVFIYRDSEDRLIATVREPKISLGEVAFLRVAEVGKIGAFLDWGLEKDLLLPFKEQTRKVAQGEECLVALYIDKSRRLAATMNVYECLQQDSPYKKEDQVEGVVYQISKEFGAFVAVDGKYSGLIPAKEYGGELEIGQNIQARVTAVKEDGKLNLSIREKAHIQMDADAEAVMKVIEAFDGALPFNDKANPEVIKREMKMSKNAFKRAVGRLYKEKRVEITETSIRKI